MNLQMGDFVLLHDFTCNDVYPVVKWYLDKDEVEIWHGNVDEHGISHLWVVEEGYPDETCMLRLATKAEKILMGV